MSDPPRVTGAYGVPAYDPDFGFAFRGSAFDNQSSAPPPPPAGSAGVKDPYVHLLEIAVGNEYADDADGEGNESKESSTAVAATTAATSWARSKSTSGCRAARGSDWRISEGNEDG